MCKLKLFLCRQVENISPYIHWRIIHELFSGLLGKSLLIIALATPVTYLIAYELTPRYYYWSLIGALLILFGYIWTIISTPLLIKNYKDGHDYARNLVKLRKYIDPVSEFKILEECSTSIPSGYDDHSFYNFDVKSLTSARENLGDKVFIRSLAISKYGLINFGKSIQRILLMALFISGFSLMYVPIINSIITILKGSA